MAKKILSFNGVPTPDSLSAVKGKAIIKPRHGGQGQGYGRNV